ncbi:uncharacterized protein LOC117167272 [Belonocnema kinseyi]|uniref:uncharacterized protein LOC117167272 n=1 Tax=Belonocnema kinseyi TaxID=2817044 RepID=UPI00143CC7FD|nr:uncharacterized protein LOC117167272 [Belonocnema kinseyi]
MIMEVTSDRPDSQNSCESSENNLQKKVNEICEVSSNWQINNAKQFIDTISIAPLSKTSKRPSLEEIVSLDTCIELRNSKESEYEPCVIDIKITNGQKISSIAIVSEASVLEIFKQCGEYASTVFAEFVDEFQNNSVYMGIVNLDSPTSEASVKFTKAKNKTSLVWLYGIRLMLTYPEAKEESKMFNPQIVNDFLVSLNKSKSKSVEIANKVLNSINLRESNPANDDVDMSLAKFIGMGLMTHRQRVVRNEKEKQKSESKTSERIADPSQNNSVSDLRTFIDSKFIEMERKMMERIDELEAKTNKKLDTIVQILEKMNST